MENNGRKVIPGVLRFINEKIAGRRIEHIESVCGEASMDVIIRLPQDETVVITSQGTTVKVH